MCLTNLQFWGREMGEGGKLSRFPVMSSCALSLRPCHRFLWHCSTLNFTAYQNSWHFRSSISISSISLHFHFPLLFQSHFSLWQATTLTGTWTGSGSGQAAPLTPFTFWLTVNWLCMVYAVCVCEGVCVC